LLGGQSEKHVGCVKTRQEIKTRPKSTKKKKGSRAQKATVRKKTTMVQHLSLFLPYSRRPQHVDVVLDRRRDRFPRRPQRGRADDADERRLVAAFPRAGFKWG
jgi:hypothetical protein